MTNDYALILSLFSLGFFGSFSHCVGMCGPFVLTQVSNRLQATSLEGFCEFKRIKNLALLPYHLGRITTYSLMGFLCCAFVKKIENFSNLKSLAAIPLIVSATFFLKIFFEQNNFTSFFKVKIPLRINFQLKNFLVSKKYFQKPISILTFLTSKKSVFFLSLFKNPLGCKGYILGLMLGFIPCGMLYGAFAIASAFSFPFLALVGMFCFGIATFPALFLTALFGNILFKFPQFKILSNAVVLINVIILLLMAIKLVF